MKQHIYYAKITEYEWGQRPDGVLIALEKSKLEDAIKELHSKGSPEIFWRCQSIFIGLIESNCSWIDTIKSKGSIEVTDQSFDEIVEIS